MIGQGLGLTLAGVALGIAGASALTRVMRSLLFQVPPVHVATLGAAAVVIGVISLAACLLPSHRASRMSPTEALAEE